MALQGYCGVVLENVVMANYNEAAAFCYRWYRLFLNVGVGISGRTIGHKHCCGAALYNQ